MAVVVVAVAVVVVAVAVAAAAVGGVGWMVRGGVVVELWLHPTYCAGDQLCKSMPVLVLVPALVPVPAPVLGRCCLVFMVR